MCFVHWQRDTGEENIWATEKEEPAFCAPFDPHDKSCFYLSPTIQNQALFDSDLEINKKNQLTAPPYNFNGVEGVSEKNYERQADQELRVSQH